MGGDLASGKFAQSTMRPVGAELKQTAISTFRREVGSTGLRMGRRKTRARASARYTIRRDSMRVQMTPPGMWGLVEGGADRHIIRARGRAKVRGVLNIAGKGNMPRGPIGHPGMGPIGSPIAKTAKQLPSIWMEEQAKTVGSYL